MPPEESTMADSSSTGAPTRTTTDHDTIRRWAEERDGSPATVPESGDGDDTGVLRIDLPGDEGAESLVEIGWSEWFEAFEEGELAFLYQEETSDGERSDFRKLVRRRSG
jgi:hypothetical protein